MARPLEQLNTSADWPDDPLTLFDEWYRKAAADGAAEPDTMALATSTCDGHPSVRYVFMRGFDARGFCFFTNYESRKGRELLANPHAAGVFYWPESYRQVRVEGSVEQVSVAESDAYFNSRNHSRRASAAVSPQSQSITDWRELRREADALENSGDPVPRPSHWGGFRIRPERIEFWLGSPDRLHRRCVYSRSGEERWDRDLLAP